MNKNSFSTLLLVIILIYSSQLAAQRKKYYKIKLRDGKILRGFVSFSKTHINIETNDDEFYIRKKDIVKKLKLRPYGKIAKKNGQVITGFITVEEEKFIVHYPNGKETILKDDTLADPFYIKSPLEDYYKKVKKLQSEKIWVEKKVEKKNGEFEYKKVLKTRSGIPNELRSLAGWCDRKGLANEAKSLRSSADELVLSANLNKNKHDPEKMFLAAMWAKKRKRFRMYYNSLFMIKRLHPNNLSMRRALGYVRFKGEWLSKEEARRRRQTLKAVHLEEQGAVLDEEGFWIHEDQIKWKKKYQELLGRYEHLQSQVIHLTQINKQLLSDIRRLYKEKAGLEMAMRGLMMKSKAVIKVLSKGSKKGMEEMVKGLSGLSMAIEQIIKMAPPNTYKPMLMALQALSIKLKSNLNTIKNSKMGP